jgi:cytochrome c peroxidase
MTLPSNCCSTPSEPVARRFGRGALCWLGAALVACGGAETPEAPAPAYEWELPARFPVPKVPADNPMTREKAELGRYLFYDQRLSQNGLQACGSCHRQELAFTEGRKTAVGSTGEQNRRSSMSLTNVAYNSAQTWANPLLETLEMQVLVPLLGDNPVELGFSGREQELLERLRAEPVYPPLFAAAFPGESDAFSVLNVARAIASFERRLISGSSPYDLYASGTDPNAISEPAKRGARLFFGERFECHHCHGSFAFSSSVTWADKTDDQLSYQNDALYNLDGAGAYPERDQGLYELTRVPGDMGRFRPPTLRNIAVTAPYMHDGSIATLREVIEDHYARGGRLIESGPDAGDGRLSPLKAVFVSGFAILPEEVDELTAFLESLTDDAFLGDATLADPW